VPLLLVLLPLQLLLAEREEEDEEEEEDVLKEAGAGRWLPVEAAAADAAAKFAVMPRQRPIGGRPTPVVALLLPLVLPLSVSVLLLPLLLLPRFAPIVGKEECCELLAMAAAAVTAAEATAAVRQSCASLFLACAAAAFRAATWVSV